MLNYTVEKIGTKVAKDYIKKNHYSGGCHNGPSPCYGLFDGASLIGVLMFATPCSENVRRSVFGDEHKDSVIELHRLHILDVTPKNTESYFIAACLRRLLVDRPHTRGVISFADSTAGHTGVIYKATNAHRVGTTGSAWFYLDATGRLRHPRQNGVNVSKQEAIARGWTPTKRSAKHRFLWVVGPTITERKKFTKLCKLLKPNGIIGNGKVTSMAA